MKKKQNPIKHKPKRNIQSLRKQNILVAPDCLHGFSSSFSRKIPSGFCDKRLRRHTNGCDSYLKDFLLCFFWKCKWPFLLLLFFFCCNLYLSVAIVKNVKKVSLELQKEHSRDGDQNKSLIQLQKTKTKKKAKKKKSRAG